jgi:hypothetical protein
MEHIASLEENLRKLSSDKECGLTSLMEENTSLRDQQRLQGKERDAMSQAMEDLQIQLQQIKQEAEKREAELAFEKVSTPLSLSWLCLLIPFFHFFFLFIFFLLLFSLICIEHCQ